MEYLSIHLSLFLHSGVHYKFIFYEFIVDFIDIHCENQVSEIPL